MLPRTAEVVPTPGACEQTKSTSQPTGGPGGPLDRLDGRGQFVVGN